MQSGNLVVDTKARKVFLGEKELRLTEIEFDILAALMEHQGQVLSIQWLMDNVVAGKNIWPTNIPNYIEWLHDKLNET